ncbi:MAG: helix-turn-helix transcriptional regulator [Clostridia bacterium]|nr:helix-turn-helix transcriptional regulator [Clostridia bacterium]
MPSGKELLIQPAVDTINRDFTSNDLSVKDMARLCGISEAYFRRLFMDKFSLSPKEYIIKLRMEHAKRLLESGQFSVSEIALMCGYFEPCHFSREFKKHYGVSPAYYRSQNAEEK